MVPKPGYLKSYYVLFRNKTLPQLARELYFSNQRTDTKIEDYIAEKVEEDSCILSVYGWGVGSTYFYAQRRPCTRHFIPNMVREKWQQEEYREEILNNPPSALFYTESGAGMNIERFESEVINLSKLRNQCYKKDPIFNELFFPRFSGNSLKECVRTHSVLDL